MPETQREAECVRSASRCAHPIALPVAQTLTISALENVPVPARGFLSGVMQGGYTLGFLLAAVANLALTKNHGWQSVFYCGGAISLLAAIIRACLPESRQYILAREQLKAEGLSSGDTAKRFFTELKNMFKVNWLRCLWGVCLMTGKPANSGLADSRL